jgi:serine/threonine-protein kinase
VSRPEDLPTMTVTGQPKARLEEAVRFAPGAIISGRYRLIAQLGKGGMGEVYRADDLILDQPVALKFLPPGAEDEARLAQLHNELKVARQVSHKNVCRLYDLGEAGGRRFLTMEYVDGEDLASLLRRIGRLPHDKAVQMTRQLCAGIAAAHERGVIHRDLKPANVMIDGQGDVRITDFGIATATADSGEFVGTPQYMAPEQFAGAAASIKSDVYALGLILFEIFTGKRAQESKTLEELKRFHQTGTHHTTPSSIVRDLDPGVERVILRCLEREPDRRPASALVVAAALPGGDPLAAALAAGETPSPDVLAAAAESDALGVGWGLALVSFVVVGLLAFAGVSQYTSPVGRTPLDDPPDVLINRAEQVINSLGYAEPVGDTASGFMAFADYRQWLRRQALGPRRWDVLSTGDPSAILFWYRSSPRQIVPVDEDTVSLDDPPSIETGMREVVLDPRGRLQRFRSVPPQFDESTGPAAAPSWNTLFDAAGLSMSSFVDATPQWAPPDYADARAAWTGPHPTVTDVTLRIEAAAYRGKPVFFDVIGPWTEPERMEPGRQSLADQILIALIFTTLSVLIAAAGVLASRHIRTNRADRRGAWRVTAYLSIAGMLSWVLRASHSSSLEGEISLFFRSAGVLALLGAIFWTLYVAVESYVRRLWPDALLGWSRLLTGHIRDPRVGRDLLIGMVFGVALILIDMAKATLLPLLGLSASYPRYGFGDEMFGDSAAPFWGALIESVAAIGGALFAAFGIVIARLVLRVRWLAIGVTMLFLSLIATYDMSPMPYAAVFPLASGALLTVLAMRFGLLSLVVAWFTWGLLAAVPMTLEFSHWRAYQSNWTLAMLIALALFGFYASRAGRPLFGSILSDER